MTGGCLTHDFVKRRFLETSTNSPIMLHLFFTLLHVIWTPVTGSLITFVARAASQDLSVCEGVD